MCFWAGFLLSVILRWLPATQSVVPGRLLLLLCKPKLASLEQGLVLGCVCLSAHAICRMKEYLPTQELPPPCLASGGCVRNASHPLLAPARPNEWLIPLSVSLGHFFPYRYGLAAFGQLPWWRRAMHYGKCFNHFAITYICWHRWPKGVIGDKDYFMEWALNCFLIKEMTGCSFGKASIK